MSRCLFILKRREDYSEYPGYSYSYEIATGMWNSSKFVAEALNAAGVEADVQLVIDGNGIDAAVTTYNPTHVFIEGLWVTPAKFNELLGIPRHSTRTWVCRIHSEIPFLATEGIAMEWIKGYLQLGIQVAPNAPRAHQQLRWYAAEVGVDETALVPYLPNIYPTTFDPLAGLDTSSKTVLDVGCFGAFRPLKNHLQQLFVAGRFAEYLGLPLRFHTNQRNDQGGLPVAKNVDKACEAIGAEHVKHEWEDRTTFLESLRNIDVLLQVSMSETFNIVAADAVLVGRPILVSSEIPWAYPIYGDPQNVDDCLQKLKIVYAKKAFFINKNRTGLRNYSEAARRRWLNFI